MRYPRVSVITPTWKRHDLLLERCIPSVQAQSYQNVEHLVISDGPDPGLRDEVHRARRIGGHPLWYFELPGHDPARHWGAPARLHGLEFAYDLVAYCDDDDSLRPRHCEVLAGALRDSPEAGFALSVLESHHPSGSAAEVGYGQLALGNVATPMIMHKREITDHGTWEEPGGELEDWDLVFKWMKAGIPYVQVDEVTCDAWPSKYRWREKNS